MRPVTETKLFKVTNQHLRSAILRIETIRRIEAVDDIPASLVEQDSACQAIWETFREKVPYPDRWRYPDNWKNYYHQLYGTIPGSDDFSRALQHEERNGRPGRRYDHDSQ